MKTELHKVQVSILYALRHAESARFSTLMQPTGLQSDVFKFHIRALVKSGSIEKSQTGQYRLTASGKLFANSLDEASLSTRQQPKLSLLVLVSKPGKNDEPLYVFQRRRRKPFYGFWSCIGGPAVMGEAFEQTAADELRKQTGLTAQCTVRSFYRKRDYDVASGTLLEDKLFVILTATAENSFLHEWHGGENAWMTLSDFTTQEKYFPSVYEAIDIIKEGTAYVSKDSSYDLQDY